MQEPGSRPEDQPLPGGGWSEEIVTLKGAVVVPPADSGMVQAAGVLAADGSYCRQGALWRKYRPITTRPQMPETIEEELPGRWIWGGVLWKNFGHFLAESTARLWALAHLDAPVDGILFVPKRPRIGAQVQGFQQEFIGLMAPGLPVRAAAAPLRVEQLIVPGQGFGLGQITAGTARFRHAMHSRFAREVRPEGRERLYISRSKLGLSKGGLLGEEQMEAQLAAEGYEIFHPQEHSLAVQLARYKAARQVIGADGSALHLFAMVGRPDQQVAIVLRRQSTANTLLVSHVENFCKCDPLVIGALRSEWVHADHGKSSRLSFGELDLARTGAALAAGGFIRGGTEWPALTQAQRERILAQKGLGANSDFVESPASKQNRARERRRARRSAQA